MPSRPTLARLLRISGTALVLGLPLGLPALSGLGAGLDFTSRALAQAADTEESQDELTLKNGTTVKGTIVSETTTTVTFKGMIGGIPLETTYQKADIVSIKRAGKKAAANTGSTDVAADAKTSDSPAGKATPAPADPNAAKVYIIPLNGVFGEDISQTPLLQAMKDATAQQADIIVLAMDAKAVINPRNGQAMDEDLAWDMTSRVEQIFPVVTEEMPKEWKAAGITPPRVVLLVRRAIGGAAFFPLGFKEVYFRSDGRMGGIGDLSEIFGERGDDVVREKQRSLRLGHIQGWANYGGYNVDIVRAMSRREYVLSMKVVGGKAVLLERMPEDPSEELLTDDGDGIHRDNVQEYVEGTGNDVLTLDARLALLLGVSQGTVDTEEDLIVNLAAGRNAVVTKDRGLRIMKQWSRGLDAAKQQLTKILTEYRELRVDQPANYDNRTKYRGSRKQKLLQAKSLLNRWQESLELWGQLNGMPSIPQLESIIKQIELEQLADKPEPK